MRWNEIRVGIETPYPLDSETAAAVEAAKQHYVMTWELLEEGDDLGQWLLESFLAKGNTALPDGVYGMMSGAKHLYSKVPTEDEVRPLFEDAESFQKFLDGEDYSYGLADVPDAEYDAHYEAIVEAIKGVSKAGNRSGHAKRAPPIPAERRHWLTATGSTATSWNWPSGARD